jgi:hypothetical protein
LHKLRKQAAKELELPIDDPRVARLALWLGEFNSAQIKIAAGAFIEPAHLKAIDDALREARDVPQDTKVIVRFVDASPGAPPIGEADKGGISWDEMRKVARAKIEQACEGASRQDRCERLI